jgi:Flp pilus assembly protein TadG
MSRIMRHPATLSIHARAARAGGAAIEFALVLPVFLALLSGVLDFGWVFFQQTNLQAAVREGARSGAMTATTATPDPRSAATNRVGSALAEYSFDTADSKITAVYTGASPNLLLSVSATVTFHPLIGLTPTPETLTSALTMLVEQQP